MAKKPDDLMKVMLIDTASIWALLRRLYELKKNVDYGLLKKVVTELEVESGNTKPFTDFMAVCCVNKFNQGQLEYVSRYIEAPGFNVKAVDFGLCYSNLERGIVAKPVNPEPRITTAAPTIAFEIGQLQSWHEVELTIVTDCAELVPPLISCAGPDSTIKSIHHIWLSISMDERWKALHDLVGKPDSIFKFTDLSDRFRALLKDKY